MKVLFGLIVFAFAIAILYVAADHWAPKPMSRVNLQLIHWIDGVQRKTLQIPGYTISYLDGGSGEPLVMVHGIGADKDNWSQVMPFLRGHGRLIALDLPGFGESSKPDDGDYSIDAQAKYLGEFLDALKLPRAHLAGNSMGGAVVLEFARLHPERVQSLWLLDPAGVGGAKESEMFRAYREDGKMLLFAKTPDDFVKVMHLAMNQPPVLPYSVTHELAIAAANNYALHTRIFRELTATTPHLETDVAGLATPTLIVWGEQDHVLDPSGAPLLHEALPNSQVVLMPGIGHMPMLEAPRQAARDYLAFRDSLPLVPAR
ncbi:alpha/beta fold hydrolase [Solimonas marina]|uniref:Alpha/beta fold hydrolase n=1 Tax=Solimonas marina TaxID=2714601 RepID=A0A969WGI6_9GAMM|nr:alpha/beta fold hydrolase [Solimonas marina]NKF24270.1 alpha/beta fold hydrolase [Solimonas marina]